MSLHIYGGLECVRFFPDNKSSSPSFVGIRHVQYGSSEWDSLIKSMQAQGNGAFISVNGTDGKGAKAENINRIRSYYVDIDGLEDKQPALEALITAKLKPSAIVETKNGVHAYWYAKTQVPVDYNSYRQVQRGLIKAFNGDESAKDIARVLRIPGTMHLKGEAFEVRVVHQLSKELTPYYSPEQLLAEYPAPPSIEHRPVRVKNDSKAWGLVIEDLSKWEPIKGERNMVMLLCAGVAIRYGVSMEVFIETMYDVAKDWGLERSIRSELHRVASWAYSRGTPIPASVLRTRGIPVRKGL